jgi:hypothetical protein
MFACTEGLVVLTRAQQLSFAAHFSYRTEAFAAVIGSAVLGSLAHPVHQPAQAVFSIQKLVFFSRMKQLSQWLFPLLGTCGCVMLFTALQLVGW